MMDDDKKKRERGEEEKKKMIEKSFSNGVSGFDKTELNK